MADAEVDARRSTGAVARPVEVAQVDLQLADAEPVAAAVDVGERRRGGRCARPRRRRRRCRRRPRRRRGSRAAARAGPASARRRGRRRRPCRRRGRSRRRRRPRRRPPRWPSADAAASTPAADGRPRRSRSATPTIRVHGGAVSPRSRRSWRPAISRSMAISASGISGPSPPAPARCPKLKSSSAAKPATISDRHADRGGHARGVRSAGRRRVAVLGARRRSRRRRRSPRCHRRRAARPRRRARSAGRSPSAAAQAAADAADDLVLAGAREAAPLGGGGPPGSGLALRGIGRDDHAWPVCAPGRRATIGNDPTPGSGMTLGRPAVGPAP